MLRTHPVRSRPHGRKLSGNTEPPPPLLRIRMNEARRLPEVRVPTETAPKRCCNSAFRGRLGSCQDRRRPRDSGAWPHEQPSSECASALGPDAGSPRFAQDSLRPAQGLRRIPPNSGRRPLPFATIVPGFLPKRAVEALKGELSGPVPIDSTHLMMRVRPGH